MRDTFTNAISRWEDVLPPARDDGPIPRIVHQTYFRRELPPLLERTTEQLRHDNPEWEYRFYDDAAVDAFVRRHFSRAVYRQFSRIAPSYGVVKADIFRYMAVFITGGVYLDIKSTAARPLDEVVAPVDGFLVSHWDNAPGQPHEGWGQHPELADLPHGEIQQWHVIAAPGHPFLRRVIATALARIEAYRPWHDGVGWLGVITLSGPIMYTKAITPLLPHHRHTAVRDQDEVDLLYSVAGGTSHKTFFKSHYIENPRSIIRMPFHLKLAGRVYSAFLNFTQARQGKKISDR